MRKDRDSTLANDKEREETSTGNSSYKWYALSLLFVIYTINMIDRTILGILSQDIKNELHISDSQIGLLGGMAFALFYAFMGFPLARIADRWIRKYLLLICLFSWSGMTIISGMAQNYIQLLIARIGIAIGEAGGTPSSHSMISDFFPPARRGTALSIFSVGIYFGAVLGLLLGGWVNEVYGWRWAFIAAGAPGILMSMLGFFTLKEPKRGQYDSVPNTDEVPSFSMVVRYLFVRSKSFRYLAFGTSFNNLVSAGIFLWLPAFLMRSHNMTSSEVGFSLALITLLGNSLGTFLGGYLADRWALKYDKRWYLWMPIISSLSYIPFALISFLSPQVEVSLAVYGLAALLGSMWLGPSFTVAQNLAGPRMRGMASSAILFLGVLIGQGLGPQLIGTLSDVFTRSTNWGQDSLRWAMIISLLFCIVACGFYIKAIPFLKTDLGKKDTS